MTDNNLLRAAALNAKIDEALSRLLQVSKDLDNLYADLRILLTQIQNEAE